MNRCMVSLIAAVSLAAGAPAWGGGKPPADWPMLAHDAGRSGATAREIRPPFERKWYRLFPDEGLMAGVQPIIAGGKVLFTSADGRVYAVRAADGAKAWEYATPQALWNAPAAHALILREKGERLTAFLDIPWCKADLFHIQKLVLAIEGTGEVSWRAGEKQ